MSDGTIQTLESHLCEVGELAAYFANKMNLADVGELLGVVHDFGKYSEEFQNYIRSAKGEINYDEDVYVDFKKNKGKIDHSTAGAQWLWKELDNKLCGQILALCVASHHSGLIDCVSPDGFPVFWKRMEKGEGKTHLKECSEKEDAKKILERAKSLVNPTLENMKKQLKQFLNDTQHGHKVSKKIQHFYVGLWTRFLFSCLIDADRINSCEFAIPKAKKYRINLQENLDWQVLADRAEKYLPSLSSESEVDRIRQIISDKCKESAFKKQGIYTLTVPTGGGKTLSTLRYALHHAKKYNLDRIIYIIPYTSIIEQNAEAIRKAVELEGDRFSYVLEHHSNLEPDRITWRNKLSSQNWDSPIVLTTMVQFLETLFSGGTSSPRRLHNLAKSILIFDEIQTLPIRCVHLLCNSFNFLNTYMKTSIVLCTATQPLLNKELKHPEFGYLATPPELIGNNKEVKTLFKKLKRVSIKNEIRNEKWTQEEIAELAIEQFNKNKSCLVIANTKKWAREIYKIIEKEMSSKKVFHLSAYMCPKHRKDIFEKVRDLLSKDEKFICISTQLIEAGVDIDFEIVIRFLAGLDSIAQAAGRCNRHGKREKGDVYIVNPRDEPIDMLEDIKVGAEKTDRVLREINLNGNDIIDSPEIMNRYFLYYFFDRSEEMCYNIENEKDTLLNLLSDNDLNTSKWCLWKHSFMSAGKKFKVIDMPTEPVLVQYNDGRKIFVELSKLAKEFDPSQHCETLKRAQVYSVNLFPSDIKKLKEQKGLHEIRDDGIYVLDEQFYDKTFGVSMERVSNMSFMGC